MLYTILLLFLNSYIFSNDCDLCVFSNFSKGVDLVFGVEMDYFQELGIAFLIFLPFWEKTTI